MHDGISLVTRCAVSSLIGDQCSGGGTLGLEDDADRFRALHLGGKVNLAVGAASKSARATAMGEFAPGSGRRRRVLSTRSGPAWVSLCVVRSG